MRNIRKILCLIIILFLGPTIIYAEPSEEPSDNYQTDSDKEALAEFDLGLNHMAKAQKIISVGDSAFAYNYRATSGAKAAREYQKAVENFNQAVVLKPEFKEAHNNLGFCYRQLGKFTQSIEHHKIALKHDPGFAQAHEFLGETYLAMDSLLLAEAQLDILKGLTSIYGDTLAHSIKIYKLKQLSKRLKD